MRQQFPAGPVLAQTAKSSSNYVLTITSGGEPTGLFSVRDCIPRCCMRSETIPHRLVQVYIAKLVMKL